MKTWMTNSWVRLFFAAVVAVSLVACGSRSDSGRANIRTSTAGTSAALGAAAGFAEKCSNGQSAVGAIFESSTTQIGGSFRDRVGGLVSATMDPSKFGEISGQYGAQTGIDLRLRLIQQGTGMIDSTQSRIQLVIYDSLVGQSNGSGGTYQPYPITITGSATGQINQASRQFQVAFSDNYGTIQVTGTWDQTQASGTVVYQNKTHFSGGMPASATLGAFVFPACALFQ